MLTTFQLLILRADLSTSPPAIMGELCEQLKTIALQRSASSSKNDHGTRLIALTATLPTPWMNSLCRLGSRPLCSLPWRAQRFDGSLAFGIGSWFVEMHIGFYRLKTILTDAGIPFHARCKSFRSSRGAVQERWTSLVLLRWAASFLAWGGVYSCLPASEPFRIPRQDRHRLLQVAKITSEFPNSLGNI